MACVQVFGLGARARTDDHTKIGYYGVRLSVGRHLHYRQDLGARQCVKPRVGVRTAPTADRLDYEG